MTDVKSVSRKEQLAALLRVARYRPLFATGIVIGGMVAALLEGIGLSFILPIVELIQSSGNPTAEADGILLLFVNFYELLGVPFELGYVIVGVSIVLTIRWSLTFVVRWLRGALVVDYTREIQSDSFGNALDANVEYFDREGSDDILNAIVTQAEYAGQVIREVVNFLEQGFLTGMYFIVAFVMSPSLAIFAIAFLGGFSLLFRFVVEPGYELGEQVADANERVQQTAQAGTQGIRDTKLFGLKDELFRDFEAAVNQFADASIRLRRNQQAIRNFYNLLTAVAVFVLIYLAIAYADLSLGSLGIFLFAMFRLGPKASNINSIFYKIENDLPHLIRMQEFINELKAHSEIDDTTEPVPEAVESVEFDDVEFAYAGQDDLALRSVSFEFKRDEFVGFVGQSGAGKSTIVSLLARMYEPDDGAILVNDISIGEMNVEAWRSQIAVVQQDPFIFNETLRYNLTIGNRDVSDGQLEEVCRISKVNEFLDDLSDGLDTQLGDDGVRLSGGQRQRVSLARALLKEADVLVLDEATSNLDSSLEKEVQTAIESMDREYAMVGIAHRLSTVKNADRIYTIEDGRIVEEGSHQDLMEKGGQYAELYAIQSQSG
ncbi:ABC transporter ATP-binding protein [Natrinema halophilum]|uniref:ABC transporter ATP-binding protein n=1 Tax=Natrinema halophilum TaxID=1699371 RepID=A0A7D5KCW5_9EURY|nr:ABC transporter ATP-binding protein [Natrinema halophilum]QLG48916.1 ABC transporter ATP-binding protein/permease [Natrinema halophilum]